MPPKKKRALKPAPPESAEVKQAWQDTWRAFKKVKLSAEGKQRVRAIFNRTIKHYLVAKSTARHPKWNGALKRFVMCCVDQIASELAISAAGQRRGSGVTGASVKTVSVKWMRRFKGVSRVCGKLAEAAEPTGRHGAVCDPFLDSI